MTLTYRSLRGRISPLAQQTHIGWKSIMHERYNSGHESDAEKVSSIDLLPGELHHYPDDGGVEKIIRKSGTKVAMDEVLSYFDSNPTARDASNGTICVQVRDLETGKAHHYYTDGRVVPDSR